MPMSKISAPHFHIQGRMKSWSVEWAQLQSQEGLEMLDQAFLDWLQLTDAPMHEQLLNYRSGPCSRAQQSAFILKAAPLLEEFWLQGFQMQTSYLPLQTNLHEEEPVLAFRKEIVRALKQAPETTQERWQELDEHWQSKLIGIQDQEAFISSLWPTLGDEDRMRLVSWLSGALQLHGHRVTSWLSLQGPERLDWDALFPSAVDDQGLRVHLNPKPRSSLFNLTDEGYSIRQTQIDADYCIYCHKNQGDYCSTGFMVKKGHPDQGVRKSPLGEEQAGCPLDQHISEMNLLRRRGQVFAALATVMVENPLCCLTGHRICNDCSLACIYQKQTPVDIPHIETRTLKDILALPWGLEWYLLLMMWNPLRPVQYLPKRPSGKRTAVMGLGPSGIATLHHLWMEGVEVVGFDGLSIIQAEGAWVSSPLYALEDWWEPLSERQQKGFGGVAEYGITVRWEKNFLKLPWLAFARRRILLMGGVRFGGTLKIEDVWAMGFHHLVLALGAGLPHALNIPNSLAKGMRSANDFLMNLHLQGANRLNPLTLMDIRLPAVVIGGGLTSVDAATELQAYYIHLINYVKKVVTTLEQTQNNFWSQWSASDQAVLKEWVMHAMHLEEGMSKEELLQKLGGVVMLYRRTLQEAPSYRSNAHELGVAMQEGVKMLEGHRPHSVAVDSEGRVASLQVLDVVSQKEKTLFARTILLAIGSQPNVAYEYEYSGTFLKQHGFYLPHSGVDELVAEHEPEPHKRTLPRMMTSYRSGAYRVSYVGDLHPQFHGSVVKALASAKKAYPQILEALAKMESTGPMVDITMPYVSEVDVLSETLIRLKINAPMHAKNSASGQFFRIHPFSSPNVEAIPLTLFEVCGGDLIFIVRVVGVSTLYLTQLRKGEPVAIMGPTGVRMRTDDPAEATCIICDEAGLPSASALAMQLKKKNIIVYLAYQTSNASEERWVQSFASKLEGVWNISGGDDWRLVFKRAPFDWGGIRRVILQGKAGFLKQAGSLRSENSVSADFKPERWIGSVFGPMQCMLKGVCAECWQWQIDPLTKERTKVVFACSWQDQPLEVIDLNHLESRQESNQLLDRLIGQYERLRLSGFAG